MNRDRIRLLELAGTWLPTILLAALILSLSFQPLPRFLGKGPIDKYVHGAVYGVLACFSFRSLFRSGVRWPALTAFLLTLAVGLADEGLQAKGTVRISDRYDLLADGIGAVLAIIAVRFFGPYRRRQDGNGVGVDNSGPR